MPRERKKGKKKKRQKIKNKIYKFYLWYKKKRTVALTPVGHFNFAHCTLTQSHM